MRILITNDDGINAPGLHAAEDIAKALGGPDVDIWIVAPAFEQSAVSHAVSYVRPMRVDKWTDRRFAIEGAPADCVLAAVGDIMKDTPPDLILSGVNRGHNVGDDIVYSGTVGAAMEGALNRVKSVALSQHYGPANLSLADPFEAARAHGPALLKALLDQAPWHDAPYEVFYNINFPPCPVSEVKGTLATFQGKRPDPAFRVEPQTAPNRRMYYWLGHTGLGNAGAEMGSDARMSHEGYVTVSPLRPQLTARDISTRLAEIVNGL